MSTIGKNIKKIRTVKRISQTEFADLFNISRASVGSYEEGRAEPKIETIITIAGYFGLSVDVLLTKELTINELYKFDIFKEEYNSRIVEKMAVPDQDQHKEDTPLVAKENYLEYIVNHKNKDYINGLPFVRLPFILHERTRAFEVQDNAMEFSGKGLSKGDILSCSPVENEQYQKLRAEDENVYVAVTGKNIYVRRLSRIKPKFIFAADNPGFDSLEFTVPDLLELWKVEGFYSTVLKPPSLLEERMAIAEKKIATLEKTLRKYIG